MRLWSSLLVNLLLFGAVLAFATPGYETNDDVGMMRIASGLLSGEPSAHLIHTNILIGQCLKGAYSANRSVNWYSSYLFAVHFAAMCGVLFVLFDRLRPIWALVAFGLLSAFFELRFLLLLQFTSTSVVAVASGMFLVLETSRSKGVRQLAIGLAGMCLVVLGAMIRNHCFYLIALLSLPLLVNAFSQQEWRSRIGWFAASTVLALAAIGYDELAYRNDPEWAAAHLRYAAIRRCTGEILLYGDEQKPVFDRVGWSFNDLEMLRSRFFEDRELFSIEKLHTVLKAASARGWGWTKNWFSNLYDYALSVALYVNAMLLLCMLGVTIARGRQRLRCAVVGMGLLLTLAAGTAYLAAFLKLEDRVILPSLFYVSLWFLVLGLPARDTGLDDRATPRSQCVPESLPSRRIPLWLARALGMRQAVLLAVTVATVCGLVEDFAQLSELNATNQVQHATFTKLTEHLFMDCREQGDQPVIFAWGSAFPYEWCPPFSQACAALDTRLLSWGWSAIGPLHERALESNHIHGCVDALRKKRPVCVVCPRGYEALLARYLADHFEMKVLFRDRHNYDFTRGARLRAIPVSVVKVETQAE
jgi:hypothetical protein